jgi:hypothetical protein
MRSGKENEDDRSHYEIPKGTKTIHALSWKKTGYEKKEKDQKIHGEETWKRILITSFYL